MKAWIVLTLTLDEDFVVAAAVKRGVLPEVVQREIVADLECRAVDSCRWRDGIAPSGVISRVEVHNLPAGEHS